jgi:hypothetical protein
MTPTELKLLRWSIEQVMHRLEELQAIHNRETGKDWQPGPRVSWAMVEAQKELERDEERKLSQHREYKGKATHESSIGILGDGRFEQGA